MSFKNNALDFATMNMQISQGRNKIGRVIAIIFSIIFLIISLISFIFSWKIGLVFLVLALIFFGISKFAKFAQKINQKTIEKLQSSKEQTPEEKI